MRTERNWIKKRGSYLSKFPPRIAEDLGALVVPDDLLDNKEVQSTFIYGEVHTGKTIRAAQMMMNELKFIYLKAVPDQHNKTIFVPFQDMLHEIKATFRNDVKTEEVIAKYLEAHLLVLDDFLTTRPTDWVVDILYYLINYRYEYKLKTIITSNHSLEELEKMLEDQRITSRINRMCKIEEKVSY